MNYQRYALAMSVACSVLVAGLCLPSPSLAALPPHAWSHGYGGGIDVGFGIATDAAGNVFVTGMFWGTVSFGGAPLTSAGIEDVFLVKFNKLGFHQWSKRFGNTAGNDVGMAVATDASGAVFVTGTIQNAADFGGGPIGGAGGTDVFIAKFSGTGVYQWSKAFGSGDYDGGRDIAVGGNGNVTVTGKIYGTVDFGGGPLNGNGDSDIFLVQYDGAGVHQWSKLMGDVGYDLGTGVAIDGSNNVIVAGGFEGAADLGGGALTNAGAIDIFLAKYDPSGVHVWSESIGGLSSEEGAALALDSSANIFITGSFAYTVDFGGGPLVPNNRDIFVAKYNATGVHQWSQRFGGSATDSGEAIAVDATGKVFVTGYFDDTVDFGGGPIATTGYHDIFIAGFDANGAHQWSQGYGTLGGSNIDRGHGIAMDPCNNVLVTGTYTGSAVDFGGGALTPTGDREIFVVKLGVDCICTSPNLTISSGHNQASGFAFADGAFDNEWIIVSDPDPNTTEPRPAFVTGPYPGWAVPPGNSKWITPYFPSLAGPGGSYVFEYRFCLASTASPFLDVFIRTDNAALVSINGIPLALTSSTSFLATEALPHISTNNPAHFVAGENVLRVALTNDGGPMGIWVSNSAVLGAVPKYLACCSSSSSAVVGKLFRDLNNNGIDNAEPPLAGWTVQLSNGSTAVTDVLGCYYFLGLTAGTYTVTETLQPGFMNTYPGGFSHQVTVVQGEMSRRDFGNYESGPTHAGPALYDELLQNHPNPFNPRTSIAFSIRERGHVTLRVYDATGALVRELVEGQRSAGPQTVEWDGRDWAGREVASGVYFYKMIAGNFSQTKKMLLLK